MGARILVALTCLTAAAGCSPGVSLERQAPPTLAAEPGGYEVATILDVIDGDTVRVRIDEVVAGPGAGTATPGAVLDVRLLGIDTPETVKPGEEVECFGREASAAATALLGGRAVRLVDDVENVDDYGRLLRYVYIGDEMANARLVLNGYASAYTYPPNVRHTDLFVALQKQARAEHLGLWSDDACPSPPDGP